MSIWREEQAPSYLPLFSEVCKAIFRSAAKRRPTTRFKLSEIETPQSGMPRIPTFALVASHVDLIRYAEAGPSPVANFCNVNLLPLSQFPDAGSFRWSFNFPHRNTVQELSFHFILAFSMICAACAGRLMPYNVRDLSSREHLLLPKHVRPVNLCSITPSHVSRQKELCGCIDIIGKWI